MMHYAIAQAVGFVAVLIALSTYQFNNRTTMLRLSMTAALFYAVSFYLLSAPTGAAMNALGSARCYAFSKIRPNAKNSWILVVFILAVVIATYFSWQGYVSLLAMGGSVLGAIAFWQSNPRIIRTFALSAPPLWFVYNLRVGSYPGMFIEVFNVASIMIGKYRFDTQKRKVRETVTGV